MDSEVSKDKKPKLKERITELEEKKKGLIEKIKKYNKELKLKNMEYSAIQKLIEQGNSEDINRIVRQLRVLEFKISTQALTPSAEKKYIKKIMELEKKLKKLKPYLNAKKRKQYLEKVINQVKENISKIEGELKEIRTELKELYKQFKLVKKASKSGIEFGQDKDENMLTLEDIVEIEEK